MEVDINADLGEGFGPWQMGDDAQLMEIISSANIACGFHAGDPLIMQTTLARAKALGIDAGAHVGFPDLVGFGRRRMQIGADELAALVTYQLAALAGMARQIDHPLKLMSFHGALGNMIAEDAQLADTLVAAVAAFDPSLIIKSSISPCVREAAAKCGNVRVEPVFHADRAYAADGLLLSRKLPGAVIHDHAVVMARVRQFLEDGSATTVAGTRLPIPSRSILVHGDTAGAVALARAIRDEVERAGGRVVPLSKLAA
ncbi:5-oxoprolinase subunit PxpA [Pseudomonas sp. NPDC007930]|uniref:LamB/YcsF family protein n=1 Tax=Pseudomonas sp. NPDC007930 TaxID=3364417 RepID=UPI0036E6A518